MSPSVESAIDVELIEANPFVSRLHVLSPMLRGLHEGGMTFRVHMPGREPGADLEVFFEDIAELRGHIDVDERVRVAPRTHIQTSAVTKLLDGVLEKRARSARPGPWTLVLTAIDDYPRALVAVAQRSRRLPRKNRPRVLMVRYRVDDLPEVRDALTTRRLVKRVYFAAARRILDAELVVFDERLEGRVGVHIIPDPWSGPFRPTPLAEAKERAGMDASKQVVTLIGFQDERKGFLAASEMLRDPCLAKREISVQLIGKVDPLYRRELAALEHALGPNLLHVRSFVSDDELATRISASDVVILPYSRSFTSTSGVLARATACGRPVLATEHGLLGWRVRAYALGSTFPAGSPRQGARALAALLDSGLPSGTHEPALEFAERSSEAACASAFRRAVAD